MTCSSSAAAARSTPGCWRLAVAYFLLLSSLQIAHTQVLGEQPLQFVPAELGRAVPARLAYRPEGLADAWRDKNIRTVVLQNNITISELFWRQQFAESGGVAVMGPELGLDNFTIGSDACAAVNCSATERSGFNGPAAKPFIGVSKMANFVLVQSGGALTIQNIDLLEIALAPTYTYNPAQPYRSIGVGTGTWPTIALAPNATLSMVNVSLAYRNPLPLDSCEQYTQRAVFSLAQVYGSGNVTLLNATAGLFVGPVRIPVTVLNASTNQTLGQAVATYHQIIFSCLPNLETPAQGGIPPSTLAPAIAVPAVVLLALAALATWGCVRRRRRRCSAAPATAAAKAAMGQDTEAGLGDVHRTKVDQHYQDGATTVLSPLQGPGPSVAFTASSGSTQLHSSNSHSMYGSTASAATSSSSTLPALPAPSQALHPMLGLLPADRSTPLSKSSDTLVPAGASSSWLSNTRKSQDAVAPAVADAVAPAWQTQPDSANRSGQTVQAPASGGETCGNGSGGVLSAPGNAPDEQACVESDTKAGRSSSEGAGSSSGGSGSITAVVRRASMPALLQARSEMAVLRDLKIGPLLGRGSYGRVYKGRWKTVTVAVKIIEHNDNTPGTASSGGKHISIGRESLLATNMSHPNVVQTYHISTMIVSQRNALANGVLAEEPPTATADKQRRSYKRSNSAVQVDESADNSGSDEGEQRDPLETWMLMEYCEKGSLEKAVGRGKFIKREDGQPDMIGIYKALLDIASGLDYLHSLGVVHGDLKTANVLLKGSARDVRGFCCKISDFGLSRVLDMEATHISTKTYGTIVYMPSELLLTGRMTTATDIYSFGMLMWELFSGTRVFADSLSVGQVFFMIAYQNWRPSLPSHCPAGYAQLMVACWHQDPEQRPTVQQLLRSLQELYVAEKRQTAAGAAQQAAQLVAQRIQREQPAGTTAEPMERSTAHDGAAVGSACTSAALQTKQDHAAQSARQECGDDPKWGSHTEAEGMGDAGQSGGASAGCSSGGNAATGCGSAGAAAASSAGAVSARNSADWGATVTSDPAPKGPAESLTETQAKPGTAFASAAQQWPPDFKPAAAGSAGVLPAGTLIMYTGTEVEPMMDSESLLTGGPVFQHPSSGYAAGTFSEGRPVMYDDGYTDSSVLPPTYTMTVGHQPEAATPTQHLQAASGGGMQLVAVPAAAKAFVDALDSVAGTR